MKKVDVAAKFLSENKGKIFLTGLVLFILSTFALIKLESDFSFRVWFKQDDPGIVYYNHFEKTFGNEDKIILLVHHPEGLFTNDRINLINPSAYVRKLDRGGLKDRITDHFMEGYKERLKEFIKEQKNAKNNDGD